MSKKKIKRPTSFKYETFTWKINYLDVENEDHGNTNTDLKYINVYTKDKPESVNVDSVAHEINHVLFENLIPVTISGSSSPEEMEENLIRFITPRLVCLYKENKELREYVFGNHNA